jgi:hypothetical protein
MRDVGAAAMGTIDVVVIDRVGREMAGKAAPSPDSAECVKSSNRAANSPLVMSPSPVLADYRAASLSGSTLSHPEI